MNCITDIQKILFSCIFYVAVLHKQCNYKLLLLTLGYCYYKYYKHCNYCCCNMLFLCYRYCCYYHCYP